MSFFSAEMEPLAEVYQRETAQLLKEYNSCLLTAAREGAVAPTQLDAVFRVVHTLKGSAALIGLQELSACAHRLEDLLQLLRADNTLLAANATRLTELLYAFGDYLEGELAAMPAPDYQPTVATRLLTRIDGELRRISGAAPEPEPEPEPESQPQQEPESQPSAPAAAQALAWRVLFREDCTLENVRAFQLLRQLRPLCSSLSSMPSELEKKNAAALIRESGLLLTLATQEPQQVERLLRGSPYVRQVENMDAPPPDSPTPAAAGKTHAYGMVAWDRLLAMQDLLAELLTAQTVLTATLEQTPVYRELEDQLAQNSRLLAQLEQLINSVSLMPVASVTAPFYRLIRDICGKEGKQVEFLLSGEELELDRRLLDALSAPLLHLIRNAVDHGIEAPELRRERGKPPVGSVRLSVESRGGNVRFTVADDGRGMDPQEILAKARERQLLTKPENQYSQDEILSFILVPGFTTTRLANEYSGRGVGMDVVQKTADSLRGVVRIASELNQGSTISIEAPVSMSSFAGISFSVGRHICLLPIRDAEKLLAYGEAESALRRVGGQLWLEWEQEEELLPVIDLFALFGEAAADQRLLLIRGIGGAAALLTGPVKGELTVVEKPLPALLSKAWPGQYGIGGCAVIGAGRLGLVLHSELLLKKCPRREALADE